MNILIVEDSNEMRRMMRDAIADLADQIYECSDGAEAVLAYGQRRPDWVLMDIKMPKLDGISATRNIRASFPGARVIVVTNYDDSGLREAARNAGASAYVLKEDLLTVRELLR